ncbi:hypothetical protein ACW9HQ_44800, partial [Nocardia gipuzkoensis]
MTRVDRPGGDWDYVGLGQRVNFSSLAAHLIAAIDAAKGWKGKGLPGFLPGTEISFVRHGVLQQILVTDDGTLFPRLLSGGKAGVWVDAGILLDDEGRNLVAGNLAGSESDLIEAFVKRSVPDTYVPQVNTPPGSLFGKLSEASQDALVYAGCGYSQVRTARALNMKPPSVRDNLIRACGKLGVDLGEFSTGTKFWLDRAVEQALSKVR